MAITDTQPANSKAAFWTGWVLSVLPMIFFLFGAATALSGSAQAAEGMQRFGFAPALLRPIGLIEVACAVLYLIPRTAVFGALLLTAYLGGAVATHVRVSDPLWVIPVLFGVVVWAALLLREPRLRPFIFSR
jgi:hypothetical protein